MLHFKYFLSLICKSQISGYLASFKAKTRSKKASIFKATCSACSLSEQNLPAHTPRGPGCALAPQLGMGLSAPAQERRGRWAPTPRWPGTWGFRQARSSQQVVKILYSSPHVRDSSMQWWIFGALGSVAQLYPPNPRLNLLSRLFANSCFSLFPMADSQRIIHIQGWCEPSLRDWSLGGSLYPMESSAHPARSPHWSQHQGGLEQPEPPGQLICPFLKLLECS